MSDTGRLQVSFDSDVREWLEENYKAEGYATLSKFINGLCREGMDKRTVASEKPENLTPEQQYDAIIEEMGRLNQRFDAKFQAIRALVPDDYPPVNNEGDLKKTINFLWKRISDANGFVRIRGGAVAIGRADLKEYENLGRLHLEKIKMESERTAQ